MAVCKIVLYSQREDLLRKKSAPVRQDDPGLKQLVRDLKDTLAAHDDGIGLARRDDPQKVLHDLEHAVRVLKLRHHDQNQHQHGNNRQQGIIGNRPGKQKSLVLEKALKDLLAKLPGVLQNVFELV